MELLMQPYVVALPILMVEGISMTRLVVGNGVAVTETVIGFGCTT